MGEYLLTFGDMLIDWPSLSSDVHAHQILTPSLIKSLWHKYARLLLIMNLV